MFIFLLRQKNEPKKTLCEKYASAPLWHFSQYCIRRVAPHIFLRSAYCRHSRESGNPLAGRIAIRPYRRIPYGMHRSVKSMHINKTAFLWECYLLDPVRGLILVEKTATPSYSTPYGVAQQRTTFFSANISCRMARKT